MIEHTEIIPVFYVPAGILALALLPLPYGYYTLLRLIVCGSFGYQFYRFYSVEKIIGSKGIPLILLILFYNPVIPVHLAKSVWSVLNLLTIVFLFYKVRAIKRVE